MKRTRILGLLIRDRIKESGRTQKVLSEFSSIISSRLGFHEVSDDICSRTGIIVLHLTGSEEEQNELQKRLDEIGGLEVKEMLFEY